MSLPRAALDGDALLPDGTLVLVLEKQEYDGYTFYSIDNNGVRGLVWPDQIHIMTQSELEEYSASLPTTPPTPTPSPTVTPISGLEYYHQEDGSIGISGYTGSETDLVIPAEIGGDSVTGIGLIAFRDCIGLKSVVLPDTVTYIGDGAFGGCTNLSSVTIPDSVTSIDQHLAIAQV